MTATLDHSLAQSSCGLIVLDNVRWETYESLLEDLQEQHVRITYDQGRMVLMSPLPIHERIKKLAGRLIEQATLELDIPIASFGSTTWRRQDLAKGLEPDECYYIENEPLVRGRSDIDLKSDPPPDLAVEVDITHNPIDRPSVYAALGVRELWRFNGEHFQILRRVSESRYDAIENSEALPFMRSDLIEQFVRLMIEDENGGLRAFRDWLRQNVR